MKITLPSANNQKRYSFNFPNSCEINLYKSLNLENFKSILEYLRKMQNFVQAYSIPLKK